MLPDQPQSPSDAQDRQFLTDPGWISRHVLRMVVARNGMHMSYFQSRESMINGVIASHFNHMGLHMLGNNQEGHLAPTVVHSMHLKHT